MKTSSKWVIAGLVLGATMGGRELGARAQPVVAVTPPVTPAAQLNCAGVSASRIEVERPRDVKVTSSKLLGATSWNTVLAVTGKVSTVDGKVRSCGVNGAASAASITADEPEARTALQTCAVMGAALQTGQKLVLDYRGFEPARAGSAGAVMLNKPHVVTCGVE